MYRPVIRKLFFSLFLLLPALAQGQLVINEIMPKNVSYVLDEGFNFSMWVELYNKSTSTSYNQNQYYFTDDVENPRKWKANSKLVAPGGFSLLYFEREDQTGHANFKLEPEGGVLYMLDAAAQIVDYIAYPAQFRNISYGRKINAGAEWAFFENPSPGSSNLGQTKSSTRCSNPQFSLSGGFYNLTRAVTLTCDNGDTIYYTTDCTEPTRTSTRYTSSIYLGSNSVVLIRAKAFNISKLSSDIVTSSYFMNQRDRNLPVISLVITPTYLWDDKIGIYVNGDGTNGKTGNGSSTPVNWNCEWDRPVNYEFYDTTGVRCLNQELDIKLLGGWTRSNPLKSIAIMPKKKFGENRLRYDFFGATKPGLRYKDIQMRNSGNDFYYSMMRDGFMQSIVMKRMNLDYLCYEPAVIYINGVYYGIENLRERSNEDFMFSNYGIDEDDEIYEIEATNLNVNTDKDIATDTAFLAFSSFLTNSDMTDPTVYAQVCRMMDVDNFSSYMLSEIFFGNYDWPYNNVKIWRLKNNGQWRWILFDTDFGFSLYDGSLYNHNTLTFALGENTANIIGGYSIQPDWSTVVFKRLLQNETFRNNFIDKFSIHLSTTFLPARINAIMDSLAAKISVELGYHKQKYGSSISLTSDVLNMKNFSAVRYTNMLTYLSNRFLNSTAQQTIQLSSNLNDATYTLNQEQIPDANLTLRYFNGRSYTLQANPVAGYKFKQWEKTVDQTQTLIPLGSSWSYYDSRSIPAANWYATSYDATAWSTGASPLGYKINGTSTVQTTISYGGVTTNVNPTAYFRKKFNITDLAKKSGFSLTMIVDDGAAVYVNGTELARYNLAVGTLTENTWATAYNNGDQVTYAVPNSMLKEGENVLAVEVHQYNATSSDLFFNLQLTYNASGSDQAETDPTLVGTLTGNVILKAIYEVDDVPQPTEYPVVINEVVASNNTVADEFGETDDYIELYNTGNQDIDLKGWYLTDDRTLPTKAVLPAISDGKTLLPALGRLLFWADDQVVQGAQHLTFKLSKEGGTVILSMPLTTPIVIDSVAYPTLEKNVSYSRVTDGNTRWSIQGMTCNLSNSLASTLTETTTPVEIYPTLVTDWFTVRNASGKPLIIFDLTGKKVYQTMCNSDEFFVQGSFLKAGIYLVRVGNDNQKILKR
jgi:hypothetical protein